VNEGDDFQYALNCARSIARKYSSKLKPLVSYDEVYASALYGMVLADKEWKPGKTAWRFFVYRKMLYTVIDDVRRWTHSRNGTARKVVLTENPESLLDQTSNRPWHKLELEDLVKVIRNATTPLLARTAVQHWVHGLSSDAIAKRDGVSRHAIHKRLENIRRLIRDAPAFSSREDSKEHRSPA
jgi:DNA-directed RNA polymerase specialized sigma24 family protein